MSIGRKITDTIRIYIFIILLYCAISTNIMEINVNPRKTFVALYDSF